MCLKVPLGPRGTPTGTSISGALRPVGGSAAERPVPAVGVLRGGFGFSGWLNPHQKNVAQVFSGGGVRWVSVGSAAFAYRPAYG